MFSSVSAAGAVVYPDTDMVWMWTADGAVDIVVEQSSAVDEAAPWTQGKAAPRLRPSVRRGRGSPPDGARLVVNPGGPAESTTA
jgi:hypothetical protein